MYPCSPGGPPSSSTWSNRTYRSRSKCGVVLSNRVKRYRPLTLKFRVGRVTTLMVPAPMLALASAVWRSRLEALSSGGIAELIVYGRSVSFCCDWPSDRVACTFVLGAGR